MKHLFPVFCKVLAAGRTPNAGYFGTEGSSGTARAVRFQLADTLKDRRARALPLKNVSLKDRRARALPLKSVSLKDRRARALPLKSVSQRRRVRWRGLQRESAALMASPSLRSTLSLTSGFIVDSILIATTVFLCAALQFTATVAVAQPPTEDDADRMIAVTISASQADHQPLAGNSVRRVCAAAPDENAPAWNVEGWQAYQRLWNELAANPDDPVLRKYLGLPIGSAAERDTFVIKSARGRSAPKWLGWRSGSYRQTETPHLQLFSHADEATTREVATDMEHVFWVWTQLFFPLWEGNHQVALHLRDIDPDQSVASSLARNPARLASRRKLRIVLLKDADDYARTLGTSTPGINQSTGFYSDQRQTSFF